MTRRVVSPMLHYVVVVLLIIPVFVRGGTCPQAGQYLIGGTTCTNCTAGSYCPGDDSKYPCNPGTWASAAQTTCALSKSGTYSGAGQATCTECPPGTYNQFQGSNSSSACLLCPMGTYSPYAAMSSCFECSAGTYNPNQGSNTSNACIFCDPGTYNLFAWATSSSACVPCQAGTYSSFGESACSPCPAGSYNPNTGSNSSSACIRCSPGTYCLYIGQVSAAACLPCAPGDYSTAGQKFCFSCTQGTYAANSGQGSCTPCSPGTFNPSTRSNSSAACIPCPAGSYNPSSGSSSSAACVACPTGTFSSSPGQQACSLCPAGSFNPSTGSSSSAACILCPPGSYNPNTGSTSSGACVPTTPGTFTNVSGSATFRTCSIGSFAAGYNNTACLQCPNGTSTVNVGMSSCQLVCLAGTYVNSSGTGCTICPAGQFSSTVNAAQCTFCPVGTYSATAGANSSQSCIRCAAGTYGEVEGAVSQAMCTPCQMGTYNPSNGSTSSAACRQCPLGTFSTVIGASSVSACGLCPAGSYAAYPGATGCDVCSPGTYSATLGARSVSSCLLCPEGTWSNSSGANASASCAACPAGSYAPQLGSTECVLCDAGTYSVSGAAACLPCPLGTFNSLRGSASALACLLCPAGTYGLNPAATSNASCMPCGMGQFSPSAGATSFTSCRQCPAGTYGNRSISPSCPKCPLGTASSVIGSATPTDCAQCLPGTYANESGQSSCLPCMPGSMQSGRGQSSCVLCPAGTASSMAGATMCSLCPSGYFAPAAGLSQCMRCPAGTLQLQTGGTSCAACPADYSQQPASLAGSFQVEVCGSFSQALVVNWGPVESPVLLAANVSVVGAAVPDWLSVRVTGARIITFWSDLVPSYASRVTGGILNITLAVTHTCRSIPLYSTVTFYFTRTDPAFILASGGRSIVEACPDFDVQFAALLGTCAQQTNVVVTFDNGSALPPFIFYAYGNSLLEVVGTVPVGVPPFRIVAVAQLGNESFRSAFVQVAVANLASSRINISSPNRGRQEEVVKACPFINIPFVITRATTCGQIRTSVSLVDGGVLPGFLSTATSGFSGGGGGMATTSFTLSVFGTVPEGYRDFSIIVSASTGGGEVTNSTPVAVTRPRLGSSANLSLAWRSAGSNVTTVATSSVAATPLQLGAQYGIPLHVSVSIAAGADPICSSLIIAVSSAGATNPTQLQLPSWVTLTPVSASSLLISCNPSSDVDLGTSVTLFVWVTDGGRNPGFNLTIRTELSLRLIAADTTASSAMMVTTMPFVASPASVLEMKLEVELGNESSAASSPVLICPSSTTAAFCSPSSGGGDLPSVGAFGTLAGVNAVLQGLRIYIPQDSQRNIINTSNVMLRLTLKESVNPMSLTTNEVPFSALAPYPGVAQIKSLSLFGKVGKPLLENLENYFSTGGGSSSGSGVDFTLKNSSSTSWLSIQSGLTSGTPPFYPPALLLVHFVIRASDRYTSVEANGTVNVSLPALPVVKTPLPLTHWYVTSSKQLDIQLPPGIIYDPEDGTISFELQQFTDGSSPDALQPLPAFISFDAKNLRISGTPQADDVGVYALVLSGTSTWDTWSGKASVVIRVTVEQSWGDFFAWVYSLAGYCGTALGLITWCLVYRSLLTNMVMFPRRFISSPPKTLCMTGRYIPSPVEGGPPHRAHDIKRVHVARVKDQPMATSAILTCAAAPSDYLKFLNRLAHTKETAGLFSGPSWLHADITRNETIELRVDFATLRQQISSGEVLPADEYYVDITSTGLWSSGAIIEAFTFHVSDLHLPLNHNSGDGLDIPQDPKHHRQEYVKRQVDLLEDIIGDGGGQMNRRSGEIGTMALDSNPIPPQMDAMPRQSEESWIDPYTGKRVLIHPLREQAAATVKQNRTGHDSDEEDGSRTFPTVDPPVVLQVEL